VVLQPIDPKQLHLFDALREIRHLGSILEHPDQELAEEAFKKTNRCACPAQGSALGP